MTTQGKYFRSQTVELVNYDRHGSPYTARAWRYSGSGKLWVVVRTNRDEYPLLVEPDDVEPVTERRQPGLPIWAK